MRVTKDGRRALSVLSVMTALFTPLSLAQAVQIYRLTATSVAITAPAPLFTSNTISGTITLADGVAPGMSFGAASVLGTTLNFGGIVGTLAAIQADVAPGPVQVFGTRSADGQSFSMLDFRFGFSPATPGCGFVCAGQIIINSGFDPSNFIAIDDVAGTTLSVIDSFTPRFALIPEPLGLGVFASGLLVLLRTRRA